ncbi:MAG: ATP-binding protein [Turicibacter sp.]|nr:ATP-binding protein [Turicibacter sp.]
MFSKMSIVKKMILSFTFLMSVFLAIILYSLYFTSTIRDRHVYLSDFALKRSDIILEFRREFRGLADKIMFTFNDPAWLEAASITDINDMHESIDISIYILLDLIDEYYLAISRDAYINNISDFAMNYEVITNISYLLSYINSLHEHYVVAGVADYQNFSSIGPAYRTPVFDLLENISELNVLIVSEITNDLYNRQDQYFRFNLFAAFFTLAAAIMTLYFIRYDLKKRIALFETKAEFVKNGDFDVDVTIDGNDEISHISNIMSDIFIIFKNLTNQIIFVSNEINSGNVNSRLHEKQFVGGYRKTADAINILAKEIMDITAAKTEQEYYKYVKFIMDTAPLCITFFDEDFNIIDCNEETVRRYQAKNKEGYIKNFHKFSPEIQPDGIPSEIKSWQMLTKIMEFGHFEFEWLHIDSQGNEIPSNIIGYKSKLFGKIAAITYAVDMRDFYRIIEEVERSARAEEMNIAKNRFLARMSHEIRTPISAVLGIAEIQLQSSTISIEVEEAFAKIYNSAQILLAIINDILDISKIESEHMVILNKKYDVASLINDIIHVNVFRLGSKKIKFNIEIDENIPCFLKGDDLRIKQVMNNLLSNAFKYTEKGRIDLIIKYQIKEGRSYLCFTVADTGFGMTKEDLACLFEEFARFNKEKTQNIEGLGLGMAIVRNLSQMLDADLKVESEFDVGTTITFDVPQEPETTELLGKELSENLKNFKLSNHFAMKRMTFKPESMPYGAVLIVDDLDTNLFVAKGLLSFYDLNIETVESGYAALDLIRAGKVYDIIFLDHMMPGMDGMETISIMRSEGYTAPIVALTANALIGQSEIFLQHGFDGFVSKPIDVSHLNAILTKFVRDKYPIEVVEEARKNAKKRNEEREAGVWEFFSGGTENSVANEFLNTLYRDFSRSQKNVIAEMRAALENNDVKTCKRITHTLKGLARTIRKNELADAAHELEKIFENNEMDANTTALIDRLEVRLKVVLEEISTSPDLTDSSAENINNILDELAVLLMDSSIEALQVAEKLKNIPQAAIIVRQIEDFDFDGAIKNLPILRDVRNMHGKEDLQ